MKYNPHTYQTRAGAFILSRPYCALFMQMGLGKTVVTLSALDRLIYEEGEISRALVIAPKSVALNTWTTEAAKWDHLQHLRVSVVMGTPAQREKALSAEADIYVTNRDNIAWLVLKYGKRWPFDMVVVDESSSFKNPSARRFKALRSVRPFVRRLVELTGTPDPNGLMDLWAQLYLLDQGERLGRTVTSYRQRYFTPGRGNGQVVYEWNARPQAREQISDKIGDICLSMKTEDYLELPDLIEAGGSILLPELPKYKKFERDQFMELEGDDIEALTAAALANKLLQFTGGAVYDSTQAHEWHEVSRAKLEALRDIVESAGEPVLVYYAYQSERDRIREELQDFGPVLFSGEPETLAAWNRGEIRVLLCHPASVAYGLNMQAGGHVLVWYTPTWNLELYQQANARLHRQGQTRPVVIYHLICEGTIDARVMKALHSKAAGQDALMEELKQMRKQYTKK